MPGLLRGMARTAVVAGTATAVSNRVSRRQANRWAQQGSYPPQYEEPQYEQPPPAPAPSAPPVDPVDPGVTPGGGFLPLADLGITPVTGMGDETILNFDVPSFVYGTAWKEDRTTERF